MSIEDEDDDDDSVAGSWRFVMETICSGHESPGNWIAFFYYAIGTHSDEAFQLFVSTLVGSAAAAAGAEGNINDVVVSVDDE